MDCFFDSRSSSSHFREVLLKFVREIEKAHDLELSELGPKVADDRKIGHDHGDNAVANLPYSSLHKTSVASAASHDKISAASVCTTSVKSAELPVTNERSTSAPVIDPEEVAIDDACSEATEITVYSNCQKDPTGPFVREFTSETSGTMSEPTQRVRYSPQPSEHQASPMPTSTTSLPFRSSMRMTKVGTDAFSIKPAYDRLMAECGSGIPKGSSRRTRFRSVTEHCSRTPDAETESTVAQRQQSIFNQDPQSLLAMFVLAPSCRKRLLWDFCGMLLLSYDIIMVPTQMFGYDDTDIPFLLVMNVVTGVFWLCDLIGSFFVGYHSEGYLEMSPVRVAMHYLRGWFAVDVVLVGLDLFFLILGFNSQARVMRVGKLWRGLRILRLLRMAKMHILASSAMERVQSEYKRTLLGVAKLLILLAVINHFIACGWYGLGAAHPYRQSWIDKHFSGRDDFWYRYTTSLHWSYTQFTPASMEIVPTNVLERTYNVLVLMLAMVMFSSFVSSITNAMTHLRNINASYFEQDAVMRGFLLEHDISTPLVNRITHFIKERQAQQTRHVWTKEKDVKLFNMLPESIRNQLRFEAYAPCLCYHPLFQHLNEIDDDILIRLCRSAVEEHTLLVREELFGGGGEVTHMVFVRGGSLRFLYCSDGDETVQYILKHQWCCEAALWAKSLEADYPIVAHQSNCELLLLSGEELFQVCAKYMPVYLGELLQYAKNFMEHVHNVCAITSSRVPVVKCLAMLCNNFDDIVEIMARSWIQSPGHLPFHVQNVARPHGSWRWSMLSGKSHSIRYSDNGSLVRFSRNDNSGWKTAGSKSQGTSRAAVSTGTIHDVSR